MLTIPRAHLAALLEHCRAALPDEACGYLAGRAASVESVHPVRNAAAAPTRFAMEPRGQLAALEAIDRAGREVVGIYHSHPGGAPSPSAADLEQACWPGTALPCWPGAVQVIAALPGDSGPVVKSYALEAGAFREVALQIV